MTNSSSKSATVFRVGEKYTHEEVYRGLSVGNAGGIRPCTGKDGELRRLVVMTSVPTARILSENPYHDRVEGDVLVFTAAGREGDQAISGMNKRLVEQLDTPFPIYGFQNIGSRRDKDLGSRRWEFLGLLQYLRHYKETQVDIRGKAREALVFEMHVHREPNAIAPKFDSKISSEVLHKFQKTEKPSKEDRAIVAHTLTLTPQFRPLGGLEAEQIRRVMLNLQPQKFEHLIKRVLESTGFEKVMVTRYSQDGGVDVNAFAGPIFWPARNLLVQVQAKRWLHTVGRREVAELRGSLQPFSRGAIVRPVITRSLLSLKPQKLAKIQSFWWTAMNLRASLAASRLQSNDEASKHMRATNTYKLLATRGLTNTSAMARAIHAGVRRALGSCAACASSVE